MNPINLVAIFESMPDGRDALRETLKPIEPASRAEEGCLGYSVSESQTSPGMFFVIEAWENRTALDRHAQSPHMVQALSSMKSLLVADPKVHFLRAIVE